MIRRRGASGTEPRFKAQIMDRQAVERTLVRISHQIVEKNHGVEGLCLEAPGRRENTMLATQQTWTRIPGQQLSIYVTLGQ